MASHDEPPGQDRAGGQDPAGYDHAEALQRVLTTQPGLFASVMASAIGMNPDHWQADGLYWPYTDLIARCPRCPSCGSPNQFLLGPGMHPQGMCGDDACDVFMWNPLISPIENLAGARTMVEHTDEDGRITLRPEEDRP